MNSEDIVKAIHAVCKKAGMAVGQLTDPAAYQHLVYEQARYHLSHLVGKDALHADLKFHAQSFYEQALDLLEKEMKTGIEEVLRRA